MNNGPTKLPKITGKSVNLISLLTAIFFRYLKRVTKRPYAHTFYFTTQEYNRIRPALFIGLTLSLDFAHMYAAGLWKVVINSTYPFQPDTFKEIYRQLNWECEFIEELKFINSIKRFPLPEAILTMQNFSANNRQNEG